MLKPRSLVKTSSGLRTRFNICFNIADTLKDTLHSDPWTLFLSFRLLFFPPFSCVTLSSLIKTRSLLFIGFSPIYSSQATFVNWIELFFSRFSSWCPVERDIFPSVLPALPQKFLWLKPFKFSNFFCFYSFRLAGHYNYNFSFHISTGTLCIINRSSFT